MCNVSFPTNLPAKASPALASATESHWQDCEDVQYHEEAPSNFTLDDSLQYETEDGCCSPHSLSHSMENRDSLSHSMENRDSLSHSIENRGSVLFPSTTNTQWSYEDDGTALHSIFTHSSTAHVSTAPSDGPGLTRDTESQFNISFLPPDHQHDHIWEKSEQMNNIETNAPPQPYPQHNSVITTTKWVNPAIKQSLPFQPVATTTTSPLSAGLRPVELGRVSSNHFAMPDSLVREYYGNDPTPPRLVTSGMVRRIPNRQPVKSLGGTDIGASSPRFREGSQPRLQANDRALAIGSSGGYGKRNTEHSDMLRERREHWSRVQRTEDLVAFHSGQSLSKGNSRQSRTAEGKRAVTHPFPGVIAGTTQTGSLRGTKKVS